MFSIFLFFFFLFSAFIYSRKIETSKFLSCILSKQSMTVYVFLHLWRSKKSGTPQSVYLDYLVYPFQFLFRRLLSQSRKLFKIWQYCLSTNVMFLFDGLFIWHLPSTFCRNGFRCSAKTSRTLSNIYDGTFTQT